MCVVHPWQKFEAVLPRMRGHRPKLQSTTTMSSALYCGHVQLMSILLILQLPFVFYLLNLQAQGLGQLLHCYPDVP